MIQCFTYNASLLHFIIFATTINVATTTYNHGIILVHHTLRHVVSTLHGS